MVLDWWRVELGVVADLPLPVITIERIRAARDERVANTKIAEAVTTAIGAPNFAFRRLRVPSCP